MNLKSKKSSLLIQLCKNWERNKDKEYPQTWYYMSYKGKYFRYLSQFLCGLLGGHELSKTEWGYGGGRYADRWCRWCNKKVQVPKESVYFQFKDSKHLMGMVGKNSEE